MRKKSLRIVYIVMPVLLLLAGGLVWVLISEKPPEIPEFRNQINIGAWGPVHIHFPESIFSSMDDFDYQFLPEIETIEKWDGNDLYIWFVTPANSNIQYRFTLQFTQTEKQNTQQKSEWFFRSRPARILYMVQAGAGAELWMINPESDIPTRLTETNSSILAYEVAPNGNEVLLTVMNRQDGADVWIVDRDGKNMRQLVGCGADRCLEAKYLPFGNEIVFIRESENLENGKRSAQISSYDLSTGETVALFLNDGRVKDLRPSPNGDVLAFLDEESGQIQLLELNDRALIALPCVSSETGAWSPGGDRMIFVCLELDSSDPCKLLKEVEIQSQEIILSPVYDLLERRDYSTPVWSFDGSWIVFGERCLNDRPTKQLWLVDTATFESEQITKDVRYNYANYQWDPNNDKIALQRFEIGSSNAKPDILLWSMDTRELELLAEGGYDPAWQP